jgi:hypothetical protein
MITDTPYRHRQDAMCGGTISGFFEINQLSIQVFIRGCELKNTSNKGNIQASHNMGRDLYYGEVSQGVTF